MISTEFFFIPANTTLNDVAGVSSAIAFVKYIATFWSPSGSVDALKSDVGYTSEELSILLILFAIKFTDALPKSITGETFEFLFLILNLRRMILQMITHLFHLF